jgi:CDP-6-deoxy-D-xylo-4-hexulose-3-dehydrase
MPSIDPQNPTFAAERSRVLDASREYFETSLIKKPFVPGQTYVPVTAKVMGADDLAMLVDASLDMWLTAGRYSKEFEARIATFFNRKLTGLLVNSGSSANLLALSSLGAPMMSDLKMKPLERGDEVITAAAGFPTTVNPIVQNGWIPVFIDVDPNTLNATPEAIMAARTPKTRAVMLAHTLGNPYRSDLVANWCEKEGLYLVEDCCDALGATIDAAQGTAPVGSFGDFATLSFYPAHHITMGEGGAVIPRNGRLRRVAESMRDWGRDCWCEPGQDNTCGKRFGWTLGDLPCGYDHKYTYSNIGYNLKVTDMQAAVGLSQLGKVEGFVAARRRNWVALREGIRSSPLLRDRLIPVEATAGTQPSWFGFPIHCAPGVSRQKIVTFLEDHKVGTRLVFGGNIIKQPAYKNVEYRVHGSLDATNRIMEQTFWIGVHPGLSALHIAYMLEQLEAAAKQA